MTGRGISHYQILEEFGEGGMGVVYRDRDAHLDGFAAIKVDWVDREHAAGVQAGGLGAMLNRLSEPATRRRVTRRMGRSLKESEEGRHGAGSPDNVLERCQLI